ncbi:DNA-binding protein [Streptococcus sp. zg-JUN1979]|uniref:DNA-binding protein n=1 Tax=Streptococcus sp. zg-JUN1979 TaxID=3391450 RepID=UPI0039A5D9A7
MDEYMTQILDLFQAGIRERLLLELQQVIDEGLFYPLELNKRQCSKMLGLDPETFTQRFLVHKDFPRIPNAREKYPRDAVIDWYHKNWQRTVA